MSSRRFTSVALAATGLLAVAACGNSAATPSAPPGTIPVVASTNVWGSVVAAVGGPAVSVNSLVNDPSADPHAYADKPAAACLDVPEATVRSRAFRARALLRASLARDMDLATLEAFGFAGERCDRVVAAVLARIDHPQPMKEST